MLKRQYRGLGVIDFIYVVRGSNTLTMDFRKNGPRLALNDDTGDLLLVNNWAGLPDRLDGNNAALCQACMASCPPCNGTGKTRCVIAGCAGSGYVKSKYVPCPNCLGSSSQKTDPGCERCGGRGEVPDPVKCVGCDENGMSQCARCKGEGKVPTGRKGGSTDYDDPRCPKCNAMCRMVGSQPQPWQQFVNGRLQVDQGQMLALGPISRIVYHTTGEGARFGAVKVDPDRGGNLMVLLLEGEAVGSRQYLVGGNPQIE
jgi:hypothetical protein